MSAEATRPSSDGPASNGPDAGLPGTNLPAARLRERFTVIALGIMALALGYVRFVLLPQQDRPEPLAFHFENPMLDARPGERALFFDLSRPTSKSCSVVMESGLVLRPRKGPERIGGERNLRTAAPYLACSIHDAHRGKETCSARSTQEVLYGLNRFGMPASTKVRVDSIRPRWMKWGEREMPVYRVEFQRYGQLGGRWTTFLAHEAPVAGLVKWTTLLPHQTTVIYRQILESAP